MKDARDPQALVFPVPARVNEVVGAARDEDGAIDGPCVAVWNVETACRNEQHKLTQLWAVLGMEHGALAYDQVESQMMFELPLSTCERWLSNVSDVPAE